MKMLKPALASKRKSNTLAVSILAVLAAAPAFSAEEQMTNIEEIVILGSSQTFSAANTTESMEDQQNPITSVLSVIDNLPGVNVTEGDTFGFDDWSTTVNLRGYQTNLSEQQVGTTIDGLPNGESNYGGGAKANRYIDSANSGGVEVHQGTADISSRTLEALGGTLNFLTDDPVEAERFRTQVSTGDFDSRRYYGRYDTGRILGDSTRAWLSVSHNEATDWMEGSAQNERDHLAGKFITDMDNLTWTGYYAYDEIQEDNYQRITVAEFDANPDWDRLTGDWSGIPYVDQLYRRGWSTLRENRFAYLKADWQASDALTINLAAYYHRMQGRGDWVPPQIIDVTDDGAGNPNSELVTGNTVWGGSALGNIYFVDAAGNALTPNAGCVSSITFPYGGAGPEYDPACYGEGAIPVQSYRHTHYKRKRAGFTADFDLVTSLGADTENSLRGGLWYEDSRRYEFRDWHKVTDTRAGFEFDSPGYWVQYDLTFPRDTINWYLTDTVTFGDLSVNAGIREFKVDTDRVDNLGVQAMRSLTSKTGVIYSTGLTYEMPVDGLELFAGYSENAKPLTGNVLETEGTSLDGLEAETAKNKELGLRYVSDRLVGSAVYFDNKFDNRLEFFGNQLAGNIPDYLIGTSGRYDNVGGIETNGIELAMSFELSDNWSLYGSYTYTDASYLGTGLGAGADAALDLVPGNQVVGTPKNMVVVTLDWFRNNFNAGLSTKWVDDRFIDRANSSVAQSYAVTDLYFNVNGEEIGDFLKGLQMGIVINNLTDEDYLGGISGFGSWIGAPRTAVFTVSADF